VGAVRGGRASSDPRAYELRRPAVRIEDERGNPISFFHLKEMLNEKVKGKSPAPSSQTRSEPLSIDGWPLIVRCLTCPEKMCLRRASGPETR
jgi:hypothetical protein